MQLANVKYALQDMGSAEKLQRACLKAYDVEQGPNHATTLEVVAKLASTVSAAGRHEEAAVLYKRCLEGKENAIGPYHSSTLDTLDKLAALKQTMGEYGEAELLFR